MIGRRLPLDTELDTWPTWLPGDYCGPRPYVDGYGVEHLALWFIPPTFRECDDGSVEVRASIALYDTNTPSRHEWHGFLDEGHVWREV